MILININKYIFYFDCKMFKFVLITFYFKFHSEYLLNIWIKSTKYIVCDILHLIIFYLEITVDNGKF